MFNQVVNGLPSRVAMVMNEKNFELLIGTMADTNNILVQ